MGAESAPILVLLALIMTVPKIGLSSSNFDENLLRNPKLRSEERRTYLHQQARIVSAIYPNDAPII